MASPVSKVHKTEPGTGCAVGLTMRVGVGPGSGVATGLQLEMARPANSVTPNRIRNIFMMNSFGSFGTDCVEFPIQAAKENHPINDERRGNDTA